MATVIVGIIFFAIIAYGVIRSVKSIRSNSCPGCSCGCSEQERKQCKS